MINWGGSSLIRGSEDIIHLKHTLNLQDIPFYGLRFTWANNRENNELVMERLYRAYASTD